MTAEVLGILLVSVALELLGHLFRLLRWEQFIRIYERPTRTYLLRGMAGGYAVNFLLPLHLGDVFRGVYSGRRMKSGMGFAFATVIMDRFLDVWVVALAFGALWLAGDAAVSASAQFYLILSLLLAAALAAVLLLRDAIKRLCRAVCGIFNESIKLAGMVFCWSLINTFKDLRRIRLGRLLLNTLLMWAAYFGSYALLARAVSLAEARAFGFSAVFEQLFGAGGGGSRTTALFAVWYLLPLAVMLAVTLLPGRVRTRMGDAVAPAPEPDAASYLNLLPQADPHDRAVFLDKYFGLENKTYVRQFIEMNQDITILQDCSAGSNATTMLCMDKTTTFYRKYAFGNDAAKLAEQLDWLRAQTGALPLCEILRTGGGEGCCWYDMTYSPQAVGLFRFVHSNPVERSTALLQEVLAALDEKLYRPTAAAADPAKIEKYIADKVDGNLRKLRESRVLRDLVSCPTLWINGQEYQNLPALAPLFAHDRLTALFAQDPVGVIHGDLTIENIICRSDGSGWYLIDPNTGNIHESPFLDYGKLLQSLHGSYEFLMATQRVTVQGNRIDFALTRSAAYDALLAGVMADLGARYTREQLKSILMHEVIHWLRLMPYKLEKDRKRAAMFYAGLVMVANDVAKEAELC